MPRVLILFAHPALERSRLHRRFLAEVPRGRDVTLHDLYEAYPAFDVDVGREQALLLAHDVIVFQHPFYWYSTPPLLKQWEDLVLEHGWAYGSRGTALQGKRLLNVVTLGGGAAAYTRQGHNRFTVRELLAPIEQTARLCRMTYLPPYAVFGTHRMQAGEIAHAARRYGALLAALRDDALDLRAARDAELLAPFLDAAPDAAPNGAPDATADGAGAAGA